MKAILLLKDENLFQSPVSPYTKLKGQTFSVHEISDQYITLFVPKFINNNVEAKLRANYSDVLIVDFQTEIKKAYKNHIQSGSRMWDKLRNYAVIHKIDFNHLLQ